MFNIKKIDEVYCKVTGPLDMLGPLIDSMNIAIENYWFSPKFRCGIWDGRISFFNRGIVLRGLIHIVIQYLEDCKYEYETDPEIDETHKVTIKQLLRVTKNSFKGDFIPNAHQMKGAYLAISKKRGILRHATASGKTFTCWTIINYLMTIGEIETALVIVPRTSLVEQTVKEFIKYGSSIDDVGRFYGEVKEPNKKIIVSTWQSLKNKNAVTNGILKETDLFIADETHSIKAVVIKTIFERCVNATWRLGVTGTMPEGRADNYTIKGLTGNILDDIATKELQEKDLVSELKLNILFLKHSEEYEKRTKEYVAERKLLESDAKRNKIIAMLAKQYVGKDKNVLILYEHKDHGKLLEQAIEDIECNRKFKVDGSTKTEDREYAREYANENTGVLLLCSVGVFSVGVNVTQLHTIIFASTGKAKIRLLQSVGRGLRKHPNKKRLLLFDIADSTKYSKKHLEKRLEYYTEEEYDLEMTEVQV